MYIRLLEPDNEERRGLGVRGESNSSFITLGLARALWERLWELVMVLHLDLLDGSFRFSLGL